MSPKAHLGLGLVKLALSVGDGILPTPTDWSDLDAFSISCGLGIIKGPLGYLDGRGLCVPRRPQRYR
jgi:hypothetical protein